VKKKSYKIGISGSYGGLNLGDEAILHSIIENLKGSLPVKIRVFSRNPEDTLKRHDVEKAIDVRGLSMEEIRPEIRDLDLFILGGGGILYNSQVQNYLREVIIAIEYHIPVMVYAIGADPIKDSGFAEMIREAFNKVDILTVRDRNSKKVLENTGITREIIVTADPALLLKPEKLPAEMNKTEITGNRKKLVGFSVREPGKAAPGLDQQEYHSLLANAADFIIDRLEADILFIPMETRERDQQHSHAVISLMQKPQQASVLKGEYTSGQLLSMMDNFSFAVGMRLHFLIFAFLRGIPLVGLPYSPKVEIFLEELDLTIPPIKQVNAGRLIAYIDRFWDNQKEIRQQIKNKLPELQEKAARTNSLLVEFIKENL
jgi:polysaccharide pyruvyl transferase CsaB